MKWHYESDGDAHNKTHYITAENPNGSSLKDTFLRVDVRNRKTGTKLAGLLNLLEISTRNYKLTLVLEVAKNKGWVQ